jgi:hypothetical protein
VNLSDFYDLSAEISLDVPQHKIFLPMKSSFCERRIDFGRAIDPVKDVYRFCIITHYYTYISSGFMSSEFTPKLKHCQAQVGKKLAHRLEDDRLIVDW